jgi:hypothetical protein
MISGEFNSQGELIFEIGLISADIATKLMLKTTKLIACRNLIKVAKILLLK